MIVDLRMLNEYTLRKLLDLPHLEKQLVHLQNECHFSSFEVFSEFASLRVPPKFQRIFTMTTRLELIVYAGSNGVD